MSYIAGIDIGNSTTEVCVGEVGAAGTVHFLTSASCPTTGTKGTPANVHGIKAALKQAMAQIGQEIDALSCIRLNEAAPVIGDTAMETLTETIITDSSMIGHNPSTPAGAGQAVGKILLLEDLSRAERGVPYIVAASATYTYEEMAGNKQIKIEGLDEPEPMAYEPEESYNSGEESLNDESVLNGEFVPKERIIVSQSAKDAMKRKPYGMAQAASGTGGTSGTSVSSYANATAGQSDAVTDLEAENMQQSGVTAQTEVKKNSSEGKIIAPKKKKMSYKKPPYKLLADNPGSSNGTTKAVLMQTANKLKEVLTNFGVKVEVTNVSKGPSVTRYELQPEMGTKVSRITGLADDIKLNMAAADIRIEAPIPGKAAVGIEIPNDSRDTVYLKELLMSKELKEHKSKLAFPAGKDIAGRVVVADIAKMPHMLIAGTTGSGKSVFTN